MTQGLGLALLAGLPLYACGRLLRGISAVRMMAGLTGDGAFASFGAASGVLVTGFGALSSVGVPSFVLFLLVGLSAAALLQGWVLKPIQERVGAVEAVEVEAVEVEAVEVEVVESESEPSEALHAAGPETP